MARRPIAFNNSTKTNNSIKKNKIEIGLASDSYSSNPGGLTWFNGADSTNQYVIYSDTFSLGMTTLANAKPVCWASGDMTDANVLRTINGLPTRNNQAPFTTIDSALAWVAASSVFNSVAGVLDNIVTDGLVFNLDCSQKNSYPGSGSTWYDLSGNGVNGTLTNGPTYNSSNGGSILFDGANDVVDCGNNPTLRPTVFTQTSWIYNTQSGGQQGIFGSYYEPRVSGFFVSLLDNKPRFVIGTNTGAGIGLYTEISGSIINQNTWCQVTISYDGTTMKIYKNGVLDASSTWTSGIGYDINNKVAIGAVMISSGFVIPFKGNISNCLLYNRTLSQTEITQNYNAQKTKFGL